MGFRRLNRSKCMWKAYRTARLISDGTVRTTSGEAFPSRNTEDSSQIYPTGLATSHTPAKADSRALTSQVGEQKQVRKCQTRSVFDNFGARSADSTGFVLMLITRGVSTDQVAFVCLPSVGRIANIGLVSVSQEVIEKFATVIILKKSTTSDLGPIPARLVPGYFPHQFLKFVSSRLPGVGVFAGEAHPHRAQ
jgi:hypothetical protein